MPQFVSNILARCDAGFPLWQKLGLTALWAVYLVWPLDVLPDVFLPIGLGDEALLFYLLVRVWLSPTRRGPGGGGSASNDGSMLVVREEVGP
jgi:uncharacterized membrane protein YkvA (DUF1232 family)